MKKIFLFCKNFVIQRKYIYIQSKYIVFKNFYFLPGVFYIKNICLLNQNAFNKIFLFNDFR